MIYTLFPNNWAAGRFRAESKNNVGDKETLGGTQIRLTCRGQAGAARTQWWHVGRLYLLQYEIPSCLELHNVSTDQQEM